MGRRIYDSQDYARGIDQLTCSDLGLLRKLPGAETVVETRRIRPEPTVDIFVYHLKPEQVTLQFTYQERIGAGDNPARIVLHGSSEGVSEAERRVIEYLREHRPAPIPKGQKGYREAQPA